MRLSSHLRRFRWLVFGAWSLTLVPAVWLAATQSGHLTGGGFEVAGSQSLHVQNQIEDHFPDEGASPLALVAAPARRHLRRHERRRRFTAPQSPPKCPASPRTRPAAAVATAGPPLCRVAAAGLQQHRRGRRRQATARQGGRQRRQTWRDRQRQGTAVRHRPRVIGRGRVGDDETRRRRGRAVEPADRADHPARRLRFAGRGRDPTGTG